jgi:hypothetical protein
MKLTKPQNGAKIKHAWFCLCIHSAISLEGLELYEAQAKCYFHRAIIFEYMAKITQTPTILARTKDIEKRQETKGGKKESKKDGSKYFCVSSANDLTRGVVLILGTLQVKSTIN